MSAPAQDTNPALHPPDAAGFSGVPPPGTVVAGKYRIHGQIGQGGMGAVLEAVHEQTHQRVAIKWVRPDGTDGRASERLLREARLAGRIEHPNVVRVLDVGEAEGSIFLVMELLQGDSLERWVERGPHSPEISLALLMPVLRGVAAAHRAGVVHRDLKPQNIILCIDPSAPAPHPIEPMAVLRPTVIDFGISRTAPGGDGRGDLALTRTGIMIGTPLYMAPEQLAATSEPDPRSDVYALGVMLYELLSGAVPFEAATHGLLVAEKLGSEAIPISEVRRGIDPQLERVVMKALEERASRRWASVAEFAAALEPFTEATFASPDPCYRGPRLPAKEGTTERATRPVRRKRRSLGPLLAAGAALAVIAALAVTLAVVLLSDDDPTIEAIELPRGDSPAPEPEVAQPLATAEPSAGPDEPAPAEIAASEVEPAPEVDPEVAPPEDETAPAVVAPSGGDEGRRRRARRRTGRLRLDEF